MLYTWQILLLFGLIKDSYFLYLILHSISFFYLCEEYEENCSSCRYRVRNSKSSLRIFFDNAPEFDKWGRLGAVVCDVKPNDWTFCTSLHDNLLVDSAFWINFNPWHITLTIGHLVFWAMKIFQIFTYFIMYYF